MVLRLDDRWVWDSWVAVDGDAYHLFFLQAPRSLRDPDARHTAATIGHAVSTDLVDWTLRPTALAPSDAGFDDLALWTGSVVRDHVDGRWWLHYTALGRDGLGMADQRVGAAVSDDLDTWERVGTTPVLLPDGARYHTHDGVGPPSGTWRDPFVLRDPDGDGWHLLLCARDPHAPRRDDGVLAHATSPDLRHWSLRSPVAGPGAGFGQLEVPQVRQVDGEHLLVFTCHPQEQSARRRAAWGDACTWSVRGPTALGPFDLHAARPLRAEPWLFAAPLVRGPDGGWVLLGFRHPTPGDPAPFEVRDPLPVRRDGDALVPR